MDLFESIDFDSNSTFRTAYIQSKTRSVLKIVSAVCMVCYAYVVYVIARSVKTKLNNPFYAFVLSLAVSDFISLTFHIAPIQESLQKPPAFWIIPFFVQISWYGNLFNVLGLTLTRFVAVICFKRAQQILQWRNVVVSLFCVWLATVTWSLPILISSERHVETNSEGRVTFWELGHRYLLAEVCFSVTCILVCLCLYVIMFEYVRRSRVRMERHRSRVNIKECNSQSDLLQAASRKPNNRQSTLRKAQLTGSSGGFALRQELPILVQSFLITISLAAVLFGSYAYTVMHKPAAMIFWNTSVVVNSVINPLMYIIFSSAVRQLVLEHISSVCCKVVHIARRACASRDDEETVCDEEADFSLEPDKTVE